MVSDFAKEKICWTKAMNLSLAKFLEDKPYIWDPKHPKYTNVGLRDETFAKFASKYGHEFGWQAVKERWTNIRSTYGFYMRKIHARKLKGENFKVNWFMWQPCKYLYRVHKFAKQPASNTVYENEETPNLSDNDNKPYDSDDYLSNTANGSATCEEIVNDIATVFKRVQNDEFTVDNSKYAAVGEAVTNKLSQLNSYDAARLSQKILEVLAEYDENNPMNPNNSEIVIG